MNQERHASLEHHFRSVDKIILSRQDPVTGLLPASTAVNAHGDYTDAWVRDNVYSILSVWGLALAYRRHNPDHYRSYLLSQSVVKLMRGLLNAMMRQADRIEAFKVSLDPTDALHAKYGTGTGLAVVGDDEWGHLQLDATSLYLLMIAQMTASGLRLIYTMDEVDFVQNLVHYISRTYCTPDFGIWERGNKINHGTTEINSSSVGMAKAALEAMDGFNLFGSVASQKAVIHVVSSDIARSRFTLQGLLPRESNSKETDAALLSIIGYPGYAVEDEKLVARTRNKIIKKLAGRYGCKRFLLDGHQSSIEDSTRLHYEASELREFEHIESEWPLFFTYLLLDALMREESEEIIQWQERLKPLFVEQDGEQLLPELYIVPKEQIEAEKLDPGSQTRIPNENLPLVWAQSLYMLSEMILEGLLHPNDIDPLHRRKRIGHKRTTRPLVSLLAENDTVKQRLLDLGINSETIEEVQPVRIMHASELSRVHTLLGKNEKLALSGRPLLVTRTVTTARFHLLEGEETVFLPYYFNPQGFYFSYDNKLLAEQFHTSLKFLASHWDQPGRPIMPFLVREDMLTESERDVILPLLHDIQNGTCGSVPVKTGRMRHLLRTADAERIDYLHDFELKAFQPQSASRSVFTSFEAGSLDVPLTPQQIQQLESKDDNALIRVLQESDNRQRSANALGLLWQRNGSDFTIPSAETNKTLSTIAQHQYEAAAACHDWAVVRHIANITGKYDDRLEDALLDIVIRQKRLAVGRAYSEKATFSKPHDSAYIVKTIDAYCGHNVSESVLTQEIILHLGHLIRTEPELFTNMLTLRIWYFVQLLVGQINRKRNLSMGDAYELLLGLAPHDIYDHLRSILSSFAREVTRLGDQENLHVSGVDSLDAIRSVPPSNELSKSDDWGLWRHSAGMISRLSPLFYQDIWHMLQQCRGLVIGDKYNVQSRIGSEHTLASTAGEQNFERQIEALLQSIDTPDYRQLNIEALESLSRLLKQNPDINVDDDIILDVLIGHAVRIAWEKHYGAEHYDEKRGQAWETFYRLSPQETDTVFIEAFMYLLTPHQRTA
ncbi:glycoside hydrolase family 15 protein [Sulfurimonas sp. HSL3-7]|uniref:glycoside hydrolase family 15 protein n=1 Tax=Sulfonitrofixus jiaomeiensis TaxID=3131938 RepID=UPI0031F758E0